MKGEILDSESALGDTAENTEKEGTFLSENNQLLANKGKGGEGVAEKAKKEGKTAKKSGKRKKDGAVEKLTPLRVAAENIADMLSALSSDEELFVVSQEEKPKRRIDTKTLKEFSSVIKEITGVICELNGIATSGSGESAGAVKIEFDEEAEACSQ